MVEGCERGVAAGRSLEGGGRGCGPLGTNGKIRLEVKHAEEDNGRNRWSPKLWGIRQDKGICWRALVSEVAAAHMCGHPSETSGS